MSQEQLIDKPLQTITRKLAADVTVPYVPVVPTTNEGEVKVADSANAAIEGILCQTGKAGELVPIVTEGLVPVLVDNACARLALLKTSSNGRLVSFTPTSGTTYNVAGRGFTKCTAAAEFVSVQIRPQQLRLKT